MTVSPPVPDAPVPAAGTHPWVVLAVIVIVRMAMGYQFQAAPSLTPFLVDEFRIDFATAGTLIGLYLLPGILLAVPSGIAGKLFGDKRVTVFALGLMVAGGLLSGLADSFDMAWWGRLVAGCGVVLLFTIMTKTIGDLFRGKQLFFAMALFLNGWPLGMGLGLLVQTPMAESLSWQWVFLSTGILTAVAMLAVAVYMPGGRPAQAAEGAPRRRLVPSWREGALVTISGILWGVINGAHVNMHSFATSHLEKSMGRLEAAAVVSSNVWAVIVAIPLGGWLASRVGRPNAWLVVCSLAAAGSLVMIVVDDNYLLWLSAAGFFLFLPSGIIPSLPIDATREATRELGLGVFYAWWFAGIALLPALGGWAADLSGDTAAPMYVAAGLSLSVPVWLGLFRWIQPPADGATG